MAGNIVHYVNMKIKLELHYLVLFNRVYFYTVILAKKQNISARDSGKFNDLSTIQVINFNFITE